MDVNKELKFFVKIQNKWGGGRGVGFGGRVERGQAGCERRIEVFVKIQNKWGVRGVGWGVGLGG